MLRTCHFVIFTPKYFHGEKNQKNFFICFKYWNCRLVHHFMEQTHIKSDGIECKEKVCVSI